jgi:predicted PurR-regulated permease PerM
MSAPNETPPQLDVHVIGQRRVLTMVRWLLYLAFVVIAYLVLRRLAPVLSPLLAAGGIAYLLDPVVDWLEARGMRRIVAVSLLMIAFLGAITGTVLVLTPLIAHDVTAFVQELPGMVDQATRWIESHGYEVPDRWQDYLKSEQMSSVLHQVAGPATSLAAAALGGFFGLLGTLAEILLVPVFAFYFLLDWDHLVVRVRQGIPPRHRALVVSITTEIDGVISGWIRGQFIIVAIQALLYAACFYALDVNLAISVGLLVGLLTIIPFLGTVVGAVITITLVLLDWQGIGQLLGVASVFVILHVLEAAVLTPRIVGKRVGLGETSALFAVLAGGQLLGFAGVLLAVPIAASVAVLVRRLVVYYEQSEFFGADDPDSSATAGAPPSVSPPMSAPAAVVAISLDAAAPGPAAEALAAPEPPAGGGASSG